MLDLSSDCVRLLHTELAQFGLPVLEHEREDAHFGLGTHEEVVRSQERVRLEPTGVVLRRNP
jgi:hypothetical protein